jgi:glucose-1-phosphate thymidylyltransferase
MMKGIILAGGSGTRLYPLTTIVSKQLLPIYDKPMIFYPLSTLMLAGIRDILVITTPQDVQRFRDLLGDGSRYGINLQYAEQKEPRGLADAFIIGRSFIGSDSVSLVLGDNIFYGQGLPLLLRECVKNKKGAHIFGYHVQDPERYGIVEFAKDGSVISLEEKPEKPKSNYAVVGLYFYDNKVLDYAADLKPSPRGEIEITDINKIYLEKGDLSVSLLGRGIAWLDTGTPDALADATQYVKAIEDRQNLKISCLEEIALRMGYVDPETMQKTVTPIAKSSYGKYILQIIREMSNAF